MNYFFLTNKPATDVSILQAAYGVSSARKPVPDFCKAHERDRSCQCASVSVTAKNAGIVGEKEEEGGVMSKVGRTERRECRNIGSIVQKCFPFKTLCVGICLFFIPC